MADEKKLKNVRTQAKRNFTTKANRFDRMVQEGAPFDIVTSSFQQVESCFLKLEDAHEAFIAITDLDDIETDPEGVDYITDASTRFDDLLSTYSKMKKDAVATQKDKENAQSVIVAQAEEDKRKKEREAIEAVEKLKLEEEKANKYDSEVGEVKLEVDVFKRKTTALQDVLRNGSDADKRREFRKLDEEFQFLRKRLHGLGGIDPSKDTKPLQALFVTDVEETFNASEKLVYFCSEGQP